MKEISFSTHLLMVNISWQTLNKPLQCNQMKLRLIVSPSRVFQILKSFCLHNPIPPPHTKNQRQSTWIFFKTSILYPVFKKIYGPSCKFQWTFFPLSAISRPVFEQQKLPISSGYSTICLLLLLARINGFIQQQTRG